MSHTARITARLTVGFLVVLASVVGLASNAYAMIPPAPTGGSDSIPSTGTSFGDKAQWMTTGAVAALVVVAVGITLVALLSRRHHTNVRQLQA